MKKICCLFLLSFVSTLAAEIHVHMNKHSVALNETFTLDFSSPTNVQGQPNFSALHKDFEILSCAQNYKTSVINGKAEVETRWQLTLRPKLEGQLMIPAITIGHESSRAQMIDVTPAQYASQDENLFLQIEISPKQFVYEQSQLIYTIKLYRSVNLAQAALSEIKLNDPDAIIEKLGNDTEYEYHHSNGGRYLVLERKYAIYPQHAGELIFSPIVFEGKIVKAGSSFFNVQTEHKRIASSSEKIQVRPIPPPFDKSNWLAAKDLKLVEEWSSDPDKLVVGEPITWTLKIGADGCLGSQIPTPELNLPSSLKLYLDKPEIANHATGHGFSGQKQIKAALIANQAGEITLPEVKMQWWDLTTDQLKMASLPSRTLHVQEGVAVAMNALSMPQTQHADGIGEKPAENEAIALPAWAWALIGMNLIWIFNLLKFIRSKFFKKADQGDQDQKATLHAIKKRLKQACYDNDAKAAEIQLIAWAKHFNAEMKPNLMAIKEFAPLSLRAEIQNLHESLYGGKPAWQGLSLWQAVVDYKPSKPKKGASKEDYSLRELYE